MGIRKPTVSVEEARRRADANFKASNIASERRYNSRPLTAEDLAHHPVKSEQSIETSFLQGMVGLNEGKPREAKVQVFLSAALPAEGISATFEMLTRNYTRKKSLQMILRRALDDYEVMLANGSFPEVAPFYTLSEPVVIATTSRMMPQRLLEIALSYFDPLGLESTRAIGRKIATSALSAFFAAEQK